MCLCDKELYWVWTGPNWLFCCLSSLEGNSLSHWDCSDVNLSLDWGSGRADSHTSLSCSYYDWSWVCRMTEWGHTKQEVIKRSRETTTTSSKRWSPAQRRCSNWMRGRRKELRLIMIYFLVDRVVFLSLSPVAVTSLVVTCQSGCGWRRLPRWLPVTVHLAEGPLTPRVVPPTTPHPPRWQSWLPLSICCKLLHSVPQNTVLLLILILLLLILPTLSVSPLSLTTPL